MTTDVDMEYTKVAYINTIYNFVVDKIFNPGSLRVLKIDFFIKFRNLENSNGFEH
jgi:hypothetical protein